MAYDESKLAFLEDSSDTIDVLLSIGCGRNSAAAAESKSGQISQKLRVSRLHTMLRLVEYQFEVNTHTENMWTNFLARSTSSSKLPSWQRERFVRINPDLKYGPPLLDALGDMEALESNTQRILDTDLSQIVRKTAADLVASCFYFQRASEQWTESSGVIRCPGKTLPPLYATKYVSNTFRYYKMPLPQRFGGSEERGGISPNTGHTTVFHYSRLRQRDF